MKTASLKSSSPSSQNPDAGKVRTQCRRRIKADHGTRGSWSKKPVTGLFNESGEININIMLGMLFEFLKDYDHSIGLKD